LWKACFLLFEVLKKVGGLHMWPKMYPQYFYAEYVTVAFIALTPLIDCNYELVVPLIPKASLPEQVLEEN